MSVFRREDITFCGVWSKNDGEVFKNFVLWVLLVAIPMILGLRKWLVKGTKEKVWFKTIDGFNQISLLSKYQSQP